MDLEEDDLSWYSELEQAVINEAMAAKLAQRREEEEEKESAPYDSRPGSGYTHMKDESEKAYIQQEEDEREGY